MIDYSKILSKTVVETPKSGIRKFFDLMSTMDDVVGLTVGEPDFQTPWHIREAGIENLERGKTYYTANAGLMELRSEINNYMTRRFGVSYIPEKEVRIFDYLTHEHMEVMNELGGIVMLHIPRSLRLRDPVNLAQMLEIDEKYPNAKVIIAHIGRAYVCRK